MNWISTQALLIKISVKESTLNVNFEKHTLI